MKKKISILLLFCSMVLICTGCQNSNGDGDSNSSKSGNSSSSKSYTDNFDQDEWEKDVTEPVDYADFSVGTWTSREVIEEPGSQPYLWRISEFNILTDIIGYSTDIDALQYTKFIWFDEDGKVFIEMDEEALKEENSRSYKLYVLNRISCGPLDTTKDEYSKCTVLYSNLEKQNLKVILKSGLQVL